MTFKCIENCKADCCGCVPIDKSLVEAKKHLIQAEYEVIEWPDDKIMPTTADYLCIFLHRPTRKCLIYDQRTQTCKDYGVIDELPCPFVKKNGNPRNPAQARHWQRKINHQIDKTINSLEKRYNA